MNNKVGIITWNDALAHLWYYNLIKKDNIVIFNGFFRAKQEIAPDTILGSIPEEFKPQHRQYAICTQWNNANNGVNFVVSDGGSLDIKTQGSWNVEAYFFNLTWTI